MPSPSAPRRRDLRRWERRRRTKVRPRRVLVGTVLVSALLGTAPVWGPFAASDLPSTRSDAVSVGAVVDRATDAVSRGFSRDTDDDAGPDPAPAGPATTSAEATPSRSPSTSDDAGTARPVAPVTEQTETAPAPAAPAPAPAAPVVDASPTVVLAQEIVVATNAERRKAGLSELVVNECATAMAVLRTDRLVAEGRFEHDPLGEIVDACGIGTIGENLALGYPTAAAVLAGWMGSEGHRANILRPGYEQIGVGCTSGPKGMLCGQVFLG
ncbi:CAP domain-containing protein [Cellulomonas sp. URHB0016]